MAITGGFLNAQVGHTRHWPKAHALHYRVWYLCIKLSQLPTLGKLKWLSRNRFNLFGLYDADYGIDRSQTLDQWIGSIKRDYGLNECDGEVTLVTMPRMLGHGFNPVSFWFMADKAGALRAVLAEVNNTFGERHCYLCRHEDGRTILPTDWLSRDKVFHVSPFMQVAGSYDFRFKFTDTEVGVWINYNTELNGGLQRMLSTYVSGSREALNARKLVIAFLRYPMLTLKVVGMIHWHAIRLLLKGIHYNVKPQPPKRMVSK